MRECPTHFHTYTKDKNVQSTKMCPILLTCYIIAGNNTYILYIYIQTHIYILAIIYIYKIYTYKYNVHPFICKFL